MKRVICILLAFVCAAAVCCCGKRAAVEDSDETESEKSGEVTGGEKGGVRNAEAPGLSDNKEAVCPIKMFMADGRLWYDTGESALILPRCGTLDGYFSGVCGEYEIPVKEGCANFVTGTDVVTGWQNASEETVEVYIDGEWRIFRRMELLGRDISAFNGCIRVAGEDERIVLTVNKIGSSAEGMTVYTEDDGDFVIPIKYGSVTSVIAETSMPTVNSVPATVHPVGATLCGRPFPATI